MDTTIAPIDTTIAQNVLQFAINEPLKAANDATKAAINTTKAANILQFAAMESLKAANGSTVVFTRLEVSIGRAR